MSQVMRSCGPGARNCPHSDARIKTFGRVTVCLGDEEHHLTASNQRLLAILVAGGSGAVQCERIAYELWGDDQPEPWRPALRMAVTRLRKVLPAVWDIHGDGSTYQLCACVPSVDAWLLDELVSSAEPLEEDDIASLLTGQPFFELDGRELVDSARHSLSIERVAAVRKFCGQQPRQLLTSTCVAMTALMREHPADDGLAVAIGRAMTFAGHRPEALAAISAFSKRYVDMFGSEPPEIAAFLATRGSALLQQVLASSPDPAFLRSADGVYIAANQAYADLYGVESQADLLGRVHADFANDAGQVAHVKDTDRQVFETGRALRTPGTPMMFRGERRWFDVVKTPLFGAEGEVVATYTIARDMTEVHETNEVLRRQVERLSKFGEGVIGSLASSQGEIDLAALIAPVLPLGSARCAWLVAGVEDSAVVSHATWERDLSVRVGASAASPDLLALVADRASELHQTVRDPAGKVVGLPIGPTRWVTLVLESNESFSDEAVGLLEQAVSQLGALGPRIVLTAAQRRKRAFSPALN